MILAVSVLSWIAAVAVFSFMALVLLVLAGAASPRSYDGVLKLLCRILVRCFPIRVEVSGLERLDRKKSYLFIANDVNILDGFVLYGYLPWLFRAVELERHFSWPVYGWFIRTFGNISVSPGSGARTAAGLRKADKALHVWHLRPGPAGRPPHANGHTRRLSPGRVSDCGAQRCGDRSRCHGRLVFRDADQQVDGSTPGTVRVVRRADPCAPRRCRPSRPGSPADAPHASGCGGPRGAAHWRDRPCGLPRGLPADDALRVCSA